MKRSRIGKTALLAAAVLFTSAGLETWAEDGTGNVTEEMQPGGDLEVQGQETGPRCGM